MRQFAMCCDHPLSEWFVWKDADSCKRVSKWLTHQQYKEEMLGGEP